MAPPGDDTQIAPDIPQSGMVENRQPEQDDFPDLYQEKAAPPLTPGEEHGVPDHMIPDSEHDDDKEPPVGRAEPQGIAGMQPPADSEMAPSQLESFGMPSMPGPGGPPPQK